MRSDLPTGTITLLFTDIEGSTALLREVGAEEYSRALAAHRRLLREACARSSGVEVDSQGDAFFAAFPSAQGAIGAAQTVMLELGSGPVRIRAGVHTGTPLLTEEGYVGADVHLAARLAASAHGGQIVVSRVTRDLLSDDISFVDLGEHRLKDIEGPVSILQVGVEKFAPLKTLSNTNLPRPASSFVGRDRELAEVIGRLRNGARLLTLTGPGGIGKTRLAIEAASALVPAYRSGVFWVALSTVRDPALLLEAVSRALGAKGDLANHIQGREMLLLLDNLEQVIEASPRLSALLSSCPNLTLLVTSRELLRIQGEIAYPVSPLTEQAAVSLFCERAQTEPTKVIGELCACLDSLPLAIELAAARVTAVSPNQILDRISHRLDLLKGGRDADPRQQTLRATIDWSYQLLTDGERKLFRRMSVFAGGCTLDAAEAVAEASLDTLQLLVEKSLLRYYDERYSMLDTIRDYSAECLERSGETNELQRRHAEWFVALADKVSNEARGVRESRQIGLLRTNVDNFRAALAWLRSSGSTDVELRLALALFDLWIIAGYVDEGRRVVDLALTTHAGHRSELRARALKIAGDLALDKGDYPAATALLQQAVALYEALSLNGQVASCLSDLGHVAKCEQRYDRAEALFERSIGLARALKAKGVLANSMLNLGDCFVAKGDFARAELLCKQSVELNLELRDALGVGVCQFSLALAIFFQERYGEALELLKRSLETFHEFQYVVGVGYALEGLAALAAVGGRREDAARLLGVAQVQFENAGASLEPSEQALHDRTISTLRADMGEARLAEALATGRKADLEKSIAHALLTMHWSDVGALSQESPRRYMVAPLSQRTRLLVAGLRSPCEADVPTLAELMYAAYCGTTDDRGESMDDAIAEVRKTFAGEYGAFEPECSKVIEVGGQILSATLITRWQAGPFVAFSMTAPGFKRTGLARTCLLDAMQDLFERGEREIRLMVTWSNLPARNLYEQLGFRVQE